MFKKILCGTDLGEHGTPVLEAACALAQAFDAEVTLMHVMESVDSFVHARMREYLDDERVVEMQREGRERLEVKLRGQVDTLVAEKFGGDAALASRITIKLAEGQPPEVLMDYAGDESLDLIVLGRHGHSTLGELLLGSTATRLSHKSVVPVLLVPVAND
jgi:nucleotide-binding universal stress UspA family protein